MSLVESYVSVVCRLYVCAVLAYSSIGKALAFQDFRESLSESFQLGARSAKYGAAGLVAVEGSTALLMLSGGARARAGEAIALALFLLLTGLIASVLMSGRALVCNCFGQSTERVSSYDLVRNALFTAASGVCAALPVSSGFFDAAAFALLLATALIALVVSVHLREIVFILR